MLSRKSIYFLLISQILSNESRETFHKNLFLLKLVNHTQSISNESLERKCKPAEVNDAGLKWKYKCVETNELTPKFVGQTQARFIDQGTNDSVKNNEMEAPAGKVSIFNLLSDDDDEEEEEEEKEVEEEEEGHQDEKTDDDESLDNGEEDDYGENEILNFFGYDKDIDVDKQEGTKDENFLKQYHRKTLRMHGLMFPLLLAYKLKFFTVIPLLLGSLVLLIGTTGIAGFFFALFAAALGIHVKSQHH